MEFFLNKFKYVCKNINTYRNNHPVSHRLPVCPYALVKLIGKTPSSFCWLFRHYFEKILRPPTSERTTE